MRDATSHYLFTFYVLTALALAGVVHVQEASLVDQIERHGVEHSRNLLIKGPPASRCRECRCNLGVDPGRPLFLAEMHEECEGSDIYTIALMRRPRYLQACLRDQPCCDCEACRDSSPKARLHETLSDVVAFCESACGKCADEAAAARVPEVSEKDSGIVHSRTVTFRLRAESLNSGRNSQPALRVRTLPKDNHSKATAEEASGISSVPQRNTDAETKVKEAPFSTEALEAPPSLPEGILDRIATESDDPLPATSESDSLQAAAVPLAKAVHEKVASAGHYNVQVPWSPEAWGLQTACSGPGCPHEATARIPVSAPKQVDAGIDAVTQPVLAPETLEAEAEKMARKALEVESIAEAKLANAGQSLTPAAPKAAAENLPQKVAEKPIEATARIPASSPKKVDAGIDAATQPVLTPDALEAEAEKMVQKALEVESIAEGKPAKAEHSHAPVASKAELKNLPAKALEGELTAEAKPAKAGQSHAPVASKPEAENLPQKVLGKPMEAVRSWEEEYSRNEAGVSYRRTCESGDAAKSLPLGDFIKFQSSCALHFVGQGRAWYCACEDKDEDSCKKLKALLAIPVLRELANVSRTDAEKIVAGSPKVGWFCSSPQKFGSMGQQLFADSTELIAQSAPLMAQQWADARLKELFTTSTDLTNQEVHGFSEDELSNLTAELVKARSQETAPAASGLLSFHGHEAENERSNVFERLVNLTGLSLPCVKARRHCERSPACRNMSLTIMAQPAEIVPLVAKNCRDKGTLSGVMRVLYECPGTLPHEALLQAFSELSEVDQEDACPVVGAISEELTKQLLPNLFALPSPSSLLSLQCVQAQVDCGEDFLCSAFVKTSASLSHSLMLHETLKLCTSKASMLRALDVAVECPGPFPSAEARILRHDLSNVDSHKMCHRAVQMLPAIPSQYADGAPLSDECLEAHRKCGAEPACSHAMDQMVRFSRSVPRMLDEALSLCEQGNSTLLALEVSYKCPGMIPQREARESHDALALLPETQRCGKMKELFQVMSIMLSPLPSSACRNAKIQCNSIEKCAAIQKEAFGDEEDMMGEAVNVCDDKPTMMSVLHFGAECEQFPQVLRQARTALAPIAPEKLCSEAKSFMFKLGPDAFARDVALTMSPKIAPVACTTAHKRCGGKERCRPLAQKLGSAPMKEQMAEALKLCGKRDDFFAALDIAAECPGNGAQRQMRSLKLAVQDVPESELCAEATKAVRKAVFDSVPMVLPSLSCIRAHTACSLDTSCKNTLQNASSITNLEQSVLGLCGSRFSFLKAAQVAIECPGPQPRDELRKSIPALAVATEQELCQRAGEVLQRRDTSDARARSLPLDALFTEAVRTEAENVSLQHARAIIAAFDVIPHDEKLNALELGALLEEAALQEVQKKEVVLKAPLPESLKKFSLKALDRNADGLVELEELANELSSVYAPTVERMAFIQSQAIVPWSDASVV